MYEPRHKPLLSRAKFMRRILGHLLAGLGVIGASLLLGMAGYVAFEQLSWMDAFLNAAMLLGGMGPVDLPQTEAGKLFAGLYALYCGLVLIAVAALLITPVIHRVLHRFHWEQASRDDDK
jgi:sterol desaturase/sphingolipid hydroxylase (fatty acid hydroxylase superfamily)